MPRHTPSTGVSGHAASSAAQVPAQQRHVDHLGARVAAHMSSLLPTYVAGLLRRARAGRDDDAVKGARLHESLCLLCRHLVVQDHGDGACVEHFSFLDCTGDGLPAAKSLLEQNRCWLTSTYRGQQLVEVVGEAVVVVDQQHSEAHLE